MKPQDFTRLIQENPLKICVICGFLICGSKKLNHELTRIVLWIEKLKYSWLKK